MSVTLLVAWLLIGIGQDLWWVGAAPADVNVSETGELQKMDGTEETPPKP